MNELRVETVTPEDRLWSDATRIEYEVFHEAGFSRNPHEHAQNYGPYDSRSIFHLVTDGYDVIHGGTRLIFSFSGADTWKDSGLKAIHDTIHGSPTWGKLEIDRNGWDLLQYCFDPRRTLEAATSVIPTEFRGSQVSSLLPSLQVATSLLLSELRPSSPGCLPAPPAIMASFYEPYYNSMRRAFGATIRPIGPFVDYGGGPTNNTIVDCTELRRYDNNKRRGRHLIELSVLGKTHETIIAKKVGGL